MNKLSKSDKSLISDAKDIGKAMIEMYQAGFLDGYRMGKGRKVYFKTLNNKCRRAFEKRFVINLDGQARTRKPSGVSS